MMPSQDFCINEARRLVADLYKPQPLIYWADFGLTIATAHSLFAVIAMLPHWMTGPAELRVAIQVVAYAACVLAYYRASIFIHELVHLPKDRFLAFRFAWNALCGIPLFLPSFLYYIHLDHHRRKYYGTKKDGEYVPLEHRSRWFIVGFLLIPFILPVLAALRFTVQSPLGWLIPPFRRRIHRLRSSLAMDPWYNRPPANRETLKIIVLQEGLVFLWCVLIIVACVTLVKPWAVALLIQYHLTITGVAFVNALRALVTHRWTNHDQEMTLTEQLLDSANFPERPWLTELWAPLGQRFHATHHLFPAIPYHNLPEVHRRLMAHLPSETPYRQVSFDSFHSALADVWRRAGSRRAKPSQKAAEEQKSAERQLVG